MDFLVHHLLRTSALHFPNKEALVHDKQRLTYREISRQTTGLACGLRRVGLQRGDRIGIFLEPSTAQVISIFGISQASGVSVLIHRGLFPNQVVHIAEDCGMKGLITDKSKLSDLATIIKGVPSLEFVLVLETGESPAIGLPTYVLEELCELTPRQPGWDVGVDGDLAAILYTSGSTGKPKGVMLSHANIMAGTSIVSSYLEITDADRILAVLPFSFDAGLNQLTTTFQKGGTLVLTNFLFAKEIVQMLLEERITGLAGVPTLWSLMTQPGAGLEKNQLHHLRYITNTGGSMPRNVLATLRRALPTTKIFLMYGLTEAFRSTYLTPEALDRRPTSIGKAVPNTEIMVVNDQGQPCRPGEVGELIHRGPTVMLGYWGRPDLTDRVLRPHPFLLPELCEQEKVCYSGDLVRMDEEGFFYFVGRRDTMIKSSGFRISPTEVEEALFQSGNLREAAVIGVPDEVLGQRVKAYVVPRDGKSLDSGALLALCAEKIPRYMVPQSVEILGALPKTGSGKVNYRALREREGI